MKKSLMCGLLAAVMLVLLCACGGSSGDAGQNDSAPTWQEQYDLGLRYLSEGDYEAAVIAFAAAIEIDPMQAEAYIGLADVYTAQGDTDKAMETLQQALELLGESKGLAAALEKLQPTGPQPLEGYPKTERADFGEEYTIFEYDEFGRQIRQTSYKTADDSVSGYWEYAYEAVVSAEGQYRWRVIKESSYEPDGTLWMCREYLYAPGSTAVVCRESFSSGTVREFPYTMQSPIHYIEQSGYHSDGNEEYAQFMERDLDWNIVQEVWVAPDGTVFPEDPL